MIHSQFSTGIPRLDQYLEGLNGGDSLLLFLSDRRQWAVFEKRLGESARTANTPVLLLTARPVPGEGAPHRWRSLNRRSFPGSVSRLIGARGSRSAILLDELSGWRDLLGSEKLVIEFYLGCLGASARKKSFLVSAVLRSEFTPDSLSVLKDSPTISLDVFERGEETFFAPMRIQGRYRPGITLPLRLSGRELVSGAGPGPSEPSLPDPSSFPGLDRHYEAMFRRGSAPMVLFDRMSGFRRFNQSASAFLGYASAELETMNPLLLIEEKFRVGFLRFLADPATRRVSELRLNLVRKKGDRIPSKLSVTPLGDRFFCCEIRDLSPPEPIERSPNAVCVIRERKFVYVNAAFLNLFGFESPAQVIGRDSSIIGQDGEWPGGKPGRTTGKLPAAIRWRARRPDGTELLLEAVAVSSETEPGSAIVYLRDTTSEERARMEMDRRLREMNLVHEFSRSNDAIGDIQKLMQRAAHRVMEILGAEVSAVYLKETPGTGIALAWHRGLPDAMLQKLPVLESDQGIGGFLSKTLEPHRFSVGSYPSYLPFRPVFRECGFRTVTFVPLASDDDLAGILFLASAKDGPAADFPAEALAIIGRQIGGAIVSSRRYTAMSEALAGNEMLMASMPDIVYSMDSSGRFGFVSEGIERLTGHTPKELGRSRSLWLSLLHPDDKRILLERTTHASTLESGSVEYRVLPKGKAAHRWVRDVFTAVRDDHGAVTGIYGVIRDVTDDRDRLDALCAETELHRSVLEGIPDGVILFDARLKCTGCSKVLAEIMGLSPGDAVGKGIQETLLRLDPAAEEPLIRRALSGETVGLFGSPTAASGRGLWRRYAPLRDSGGRIAGVAGIISDVGREEAFAQELAESERILRNVLDTMGDLLMITDLSGGVRQVNRTFLSVLGYSRTEVLGTGYPYPWIPEEETARYIVWISNLREKSWLHDFDMTWQARDGRRIPMSLSTTLLRNSMGEPIAMLNIARDITERVRLGRDLERRSREIEMINRVIGKANETTDLDEIFAAIAGEINAVVPTDFISAGLLSEDRRTFEVFAITGKKLVQKGDRLPIAGTVSQFAVRDRKPVIIGDFQAEKRGESFISAERGMRAQLSIPMMMHDRVLGTLNLGSREPYVYTDAIARTLAPLAQHLATIIDRMRLFKQVTDDSAYIRTLLDSIDSIVYTVDLQYRIREVNKAWHEFMEQCGQPAGREYIGALLFDVLPSESLKGVFRSVGDRLMKGDLRFFSDEYVHALPGGLKTYQLTINPMRTGGPADGLVVTLTDITPLKRSEAALRRSNEQLLALHEISTLISTSAGLDEILQPTVPLLQGATEADAVLLYLADLEGNQLHLVKQIGFDTADLDSLLRLDRDTSATGHVVRTREPVYIESAAYADPRIVPDNRDALRQLGLEALAIIPLISKDAVHGALDIFYRSSHRFSDHDRQLLTLVGNQLGSTIENAQLYAELRSQIERLTALYALSQQLTSTLEIPSILQTVSESVQNIVPFEEFTVDRVDAAAGTKTPEYRFRVFDRDAPGASILRQSAPIDRVSPEWQVVTTLKPVRDPGRSAMVVPMLSKGTIIGVMAVYGNRAIPYTATQLQLLESIGNLTAIALEKGDLYAETLRISSEIQRRNKELDDFTYVVSHDLKEPLISVEGFSRILQADYDQIIGHEGKEYLSAMVGATTRMKGLIDDLLMLSRVGRATEAFKPVRVGDVLAVIATDMEFTIRQRKVRLSVPADIPAVFGNATQIAIVFRNLIGNAIKFNKSPDPVVEIGVEEAGDDMLRFSVRDNGIGIEREFHEKIFVIFQRLHRREQYEGSGAGLAIVKKIIEIHKGRIWLESEPGNGTTFYFTLPRMIDQEH